MGVVYDIRNAEIGMQNAKNMNFRLSSASFSAFQLPHSFAFVIRYPFRIPHSAFHLPGYLSLIPNPSHDMSPKTRLIFQQHDTVQLDITRRFD
jgi:hypothetical protein